MNLAKRFGFPGLLVATIVFAPGSRGRQVKSNAPPMRKEATGPLRVGEILEYRVGWSNFPSAATARLTIRERSDFYRWEAWHFQAQAHTVDPLRVLFSLDDEFDSYTDATSFSSHQYEMYLHEQGKEVTRIVRMGSEKDPPWGKGSLVVVLDGTRDPLAAFYFLRTVDWQHSPETRGWVYDGNQFYEMQARLDQAQTSVTVPAGTYSASRIEVRVTERGGDKSQAHFWLWLARDAARTPALVEADVPVGTIRVELLKAVE